MNAAFGSDQTKLKEMIKESKEVYNMFNGKMDSTALLNNDDKIAKQMLSNIKPFKLPLVRCSQAEFCFLNV